jgi:protease-4
VWNGQRAIELGLADALGSVNTVARDVVGAEEILDFTPEDDLADRFARRLGATLVRELPSLRYHSPATLR